MNIQLGEVIASRELSGTWEGRTIKILVEIGKPVPDPRGDWMCPFRISGGPKEALFYAGGLDAVQALDLALHMIGAKLQSKPFQELTLTWCDSDDLGFPIPGAGR